MTDFDRALAFVLQAEGGYVNNPADPGGATNQGVTQAVYTAYRARLGLGWQSVRFISATEVRSIYYAQYWLPVTAGRSGPLDFVLFDTAVNMGVGRAQQFIERAKLSSANAAGPGRMTALAQEVLRIRECYYYGIVANRPASAQFLRGWLRRVASLRSLTADPQAA